MKTVPPPFFLLSPGLVLQCASYGESVSLVAAGAHPNDPAYNSLNAFQQALGTLSIPAGDYYVQFPNIADNVDPKDARNKQILRTNPITTRKLIVVPARVTIAGTHDATGNPTTRIHWKDDQRSAVFFHQLGSLRHD